MKALILAAGYGTRLHPLTRDRPKPLLPVGGRPLLDHLAENLDRVEGLREILVVVNGRFEEELRGWADRAGGSLGTPLRVLSNGTREPEERLGAVGDAALAIERAAPDDDLLLAAGDNVFRFEIAGMARATSWSGSCRDGTCGRGRCRPPATTSGLRRATGRPGSTSGESGRVDLRSS